MSCNIIALQGAVGARMILVLSSPCL